MGQRSRDWAPEGAEDRETHGPHHRQQTGTDSVEKQLAQLGRGRDRRQMEEEEREKMRDKGLRCGDRPTVDTRSPGRHTEQVPRVRPSHESRRLEMDLGRMRTERKAGSDAPEEALWVWT